MKKHSNVTEKLRRLARRGSGQKRDGIALIIVLGLMAILMMMGVAFSISMRTERMGAGNFRFGISSRHLVWAGLARAIDDIHENIRTNGHFYPNFAVLPSRGFGEIYIAFGDATEHVPAALRETVKDSPAQWIGAAQGGGIHGRVAYLVVNVSDFLDANHVGVSNRWAGVHPAEITIENLPEVLDWEVFAENREADIRYESLPDLLLCQTNFTDSTFRGLRADPTNFVVYSRYPSGEHDGAAIHDNALDIVGKDVSELEAMRDEIIDKLTQMLDTGGARPDNPAFVYTNLLDYVDPEPLPVERLAGPNTKRVPMLNEIVIDDIEIERVHNGEDAEIVVEFRSLELEWFYPFIQPSDDTFTLDAELYVAFIKAGEAPHVFEGEWTDIELASAGTTEQPYGFENLDLSAVELASAGTTEQPYGFAELDFPVPLRGPRPGTRGWSFDDMGTNDTVQVIIGVKARIKNGDGTVVDQVPSPWVDGFFRDDTVILLDETFPAGEEADFALEESSREVIDPRFNWNPQFWLDPADDAFGGNGSSLGGENNVTQWYRNDPEHAGRVDPDMALHVSGRGHLVCVGELGNLMRGADRINHQWRSLRLIDLERADARRDDVFRHFTGYPTNTVRRGLVNINTSRPEALDAVFTGLPWGYPENTNNVTSVEDAQKISDAILDFREAGGVFTNASDLAALDWSDVFPSDNNDPDYRSMVELESVIAHSHGLLGTRQNLFAIYVVAGPFSPGLGRVADRYSEQMGEWLGYQRALFYVWRDPFPNADGRHPVFVQKFKWLPGGD